MRKLLPCFILASSLGISLEAIAQQSPWTIGGRVVHVDARNTSEPMSGVGAKDRLTIEKKELPEIDFGYYFLPSLSAELAITDSQRHEVYLDGGAIGTLRQQPTTFHLRYHFYPEMSFTPYLGFGLNYTHFSNVHLFNNTGSLSSSSLGWSIQGGVDFKLAPNWSLNLDLRKIRKQSDLLINRQRVSAFQFDPWLVGLGVAYRY